MKLYWTVTGGLPNGTDYRVGHADVKSLLWESNDELGQKQPDPLPAFSSPAAHPIRSTGRDEKSSRRTGGYFQGFDGALVLYQLSEDRTFRYNPDRCSERLLPASTFKIMNALVGLETGVVPDRISSCPGMEPNTRFPSGTDHSLKTAFQNSVVWYYQEVARRVGPEEMQHYLDAAGYGNRKVGARSTCSGWHTGSRPTSRCKPSSIEIRLLFKTLVETVRQIMLIEEDSSTACGVRPAPVAGDQYIGWFVGYEERNGDVYFFALNIKSSSPEVAAKPGDRSADPAGSILFSAE